MDWFSAHAKSADERSAGLCESQRVMHACVRMNSWTRAAAAAKWKLHESFFVEFLKHTLRASFQHVTYIHFIIRDSGCVRLASNNRSPHRVKSLRQHNAGCCLLFVTALCRHNLYKCNAVYMYVRQLNGQVHKTLNRFVLFKWKWHEITILLLLHTPISCSFWCFCTGCLYVYLHSTNGKI